MKSKIFIDALMLTVSRDPARNSLCGIYIDAVSRDRSWIRFVSTNGEALVAIKVSQSLKSYYNSWALEHRLPMWSELKPQMILIPWVIQKKLDFVNRYCSPEKFGAENPYPDWRRLIRREALTQGTQPPGWFGAEVLSALTTAKRILSEDKEANFVAQAWVSPLGMHLDHVETVFMTGILVGMPIRILPSNEREAQSAARDRFDSVLKTCDNLLMAA